MKFYIGTQTAAWLRELEIPVFISDRTLRKNKSFAPALTEWSLDSGGFTELSMYGEWRTTPQEYVARIRRYVDEIGMLNWASPQDAMCEPWILENSKHWLGGTVRAHQRWTVDNYLELRSLDASLPIIPVLQGWEQADYLRHIEMYAAAGVDLAAERIVGVGSVCRRQSTDEIGRLFAILHANGLNMHGYGVKKRGLAKYSRYLTSADSMAWTFAGRNVAPCPHGPRNSCKACPVFAIKWWLEVTQLCDM